MSSSLTIFPESTNANTANTAITAITANGDNINNLLTDNKGQIHQYIEWTPEHESILVDWADKAICYKWMHQRAHLQYSKKNTWFTIPVIIMSTFTGTANFAQDRIPAEYINIATMAIGTINLIAGILTTIQQYLKISELNESHRVSSIAWGKFYRNIKVEISKSPNERTPVISLLKHSKDEFDRLIESSPSLSPYIINLFITTFSGGTPAYGENGVEINLTTKQKLYNDIKKPDICGEIKTTAFYLYKRKELPIVSTKKLGTPSIALAAQKVIENNNKKNEVEEFIKLFESQKKRLPIKDEIISNMEHTVPIEIIETVYNEMNVKNNVVLSILNETDTDMV